MKQLDRRLTALEQATGTPRYYVAYPGEGRYVLPGGRVCDCDAFAVAVERDLGARVIRVEYAQEGRVHAGNE